MSYFKNLTNEFFDYIASRKEFHNSKIEFQIIIGLTIFTGFQKLTLKPIIISKMIVSQKYVFKEGIGTNLMIIFEKFIEKIKSLTADQMLIFGVDKAFPSFFRVP